MNKPLITLALGALCGTVIASAPVTSGLATGERVVPFHPTHLVGPLAGTENCFPCTFQNRPQVQVWVNGDSQTNIAAFAKTLSAAMDTKADKEFKALIVFIVPESMKEKASMKIKAAATTLKATNVGMAVLTPSHEAVGEYKINTSKDVKNTVFVYKNWKVAQKFVNLKADAKGITALNAAIDSITK